MRGTLFALLQALTPNPSEQYRCCASARPKGLKPNDVQYVWLKDRLRGEGAGG